MLIHPWDAGHGEPEWTDFVRAQRFGHLIAAGRGREVPVVVPTQFRLESAEQVLMHLARPNPIWSAVDENRTVLLSIAGDWAYIPSAWKVTADEDPGLGIPTTYYAAVQLIATATVIDDEDGKLAILRAQLGESEPGSGLDPARNRRHLRGIRGLRLTVTEVRAKFKYGGNLDDAHRAVTAAGLTRRNAPGDAAALTHLIRRTPLPARPMG